MNLFNFKAVMITFHNAKNIYIFAAFQTFYLWRASGSHAWISYALDVTFSAKSEFHEKNSWKKLLSTLFQLKI